MKYREDLTGASLAMLSISQHHDHSHAQQLCLIMSDGEFYFMC
jgi:hypothetical protein